MLGWLPCSKQTFLSQNRQNQHTIGHMTNAVRWHNTTHVVLACCGPNRTPNKNMSCKTRLGQLQTCIDTSVTLNSTTNSNQTTTRHMRAPILTCHNARVSPLGNFPCVTHDNTEHASRTEKRTLANASEKSKWCHAHEMALQTYANARAHLNVNDVVPSLTQRTENHGRIHMRSRSSTGHA